MRKRRAVAAGAQPESGRRPAALATPDALRSWAAHAGGKTLQVQCPMMRSRCGDQRPCSPARPRPLLRRLGRFTIVWRASQALPKDSHPAVSRPPTAMRPSSSRLPRSSSARSLTSCSQQQGRAPSKPAHELLRALPPYSRCEEHLAASSPASLLDSPHKQVGGRQGAMGAQAAAPPRGPASAGSVVGRPRSAAFTPSSTGAPPGRGPHGAAHGPAAGRRRRRCAAGAPAGRHGGGDCGGELPRSRLCARRASPPVPRSILHLSSHAVCG